MYNDDYDSRAVTGADVAALDGGITPLPLAGVTHASRAEESAMRLSLTFAAKLRYKIPLCFSLRSWRLRGGKGEGARLNGKGL